MLPKLELVAEKLLKEVNGVSDNYEILNISKNTSGWETDIYFFTVKQEKAVSNYALRMYNGISDFSINTAKKEFFLLSHLHQNNFPVPKVFLLDTTLEIMSNPYIVMEKIEGITLGSILESEDHNHQVYLKKFFDFYYRLHQLQITDFITYFGNEICASEESFYHFAITFFKGRTNQIENELLISDTEKLLFWLDNKKNLAKTTNSIIHLDFHPYNILVDKDGYFKIIDWSASMIGDYRADIAWTQILSLPNKINFKLVRQEYERISQKNIENLEFFFVLMGLRRLTDAIGSLTSNPNTLSMKTNQSKDAKKY